ncbi:MAG TPA: PLP-dependent transferase [Gaiellaceae bacterium]|nr:PLP-dependent transferase [Gaiellaceae bacterium]
MSIDRSTIWPYVDGEPGEFLYSRYDHPTGVAAERKLAVLEGAPDGQALLFASGSAATTSLLLALLEPGRKVALAEGGYFGTGVIMREELGRWGLECVEFDQTGPPPDGVDLIWLEAPSNPFLTMPDLAAAATHPAKVVVDSTAATPVHLRPLEHGADLVLHSATKYLAGHSDALAGAVVSRDPADHERLWQFRQRTGPTCAADVAALVSRGLKTLRVRVERQTETARDLVERLRSHPAVANVRYPGFGGLLSFDVAGDPLPVERALRLIRNATSLGGVDSTLESRHRWEGDRVPVGLLRLSVGLEDADELWADLAQALAAA